MILLVLLLLSNGDGGTSHAMKVAPVQSKVKPLVINPPSLPDSFEQEITCANGAVPRLDYRDGHSFLVCDLRPVVVPTLPGDR